MSVGVMKDYNLKLRNLGVTVCLSLIDEGRTQKNIYLLWINKTKTKDIKQELKTRPIYDYRYDERLEPKYSVCVFIMNQ
jgi:hypothetical protein